jgi:hypothetical protein
MASGQPANQSTLVAQVSINGQMISFDAAHFGEKRCHCAFCDLTKGCETYHCHNTTTDV